MVVDSVMENGGIGGNMFSNSSQHVGFWPKSGPPPQAGVYQFLAPLVSRGATAGLAGPVSTSPLAVSFGGWRRVAE